MSSDPLSDFGEGIMKWAADSDGSLKTYEGQFYYYKPNGIGTETIVNAEGEKEVYTGNFKNGIREGEGQLEKDGKKTKAVWAEGEISPDCEPEVEEVEGENPIRASRANAMFGALQQKFKNQYLEELKK